MAPQLQEVAQTWPIAVIIIVILLIIIIWLILRRQEPPPRGSGVQYFVRDQVIITGLPASIDEVRRQVEDEFNIELRPVVEQLPPQPDDQVQAGGTAVTGQQAVDRTITRLFHLVRRGSESEELTAEDIADSINRRSKLCEVMADANYKIGRALGEVTGDPNSTEGFTLGEVGGPASGAEAFYKQWALQSRTNGIAGIELFDAKGNRTVDAEGQDVVIAIFDASPFPHNELIFDAALELLADQQTVITNNNLPGVPDARDHGLFVASLIEAVAPKSEIQLVRVLDNSNRGTLETLVQAIQKFIVAREEASTNPAKPLTGTVINLSLGVHATPDKEWIGPPVPTLYCVLQEAYDKGAVIVAASGNDSAHVMQPAQLPAAYKFVIGVGASNSQGGRSCFSNDGEVYAPGGENDAKCQHVPSSCSDDAQACLIGAAHHTALVSHFAYWKGTSFATPLVTGLAALLVGMGMDPAKVKPHILAKAQESSLTMSVPIINIPKTITP